MPGVRDRKRRMVDGLLAMHLDKFRASKGWTVGADASVTVVDVGANAQIDSKTAQQAVIGYVLTNGGLMANVSLEGTKITPISI